MLLRGSCDVNTSHSYVRDTGQTSIGPKRKSQTSWPLVQVEKGEALWKTTKVPTRGVAPRQKTYITPQNTSFKHGDHGAMAPEFGVPNGVP